jgi:hypothetical protein
MTGDLVVDAAQPLAEPRAAYEGSCEQRRRAPATGDRGGLPLLERFVSGGGLSRRESLEQLRGRAARNLAALPAELRRANAQRPEPYVVAYSEELLDLAQRSGAVGRD